MSPSCPTTRSPRPTDDLIHQMFPYTDHDEFLEVAVPFLDTGVRADEVVLCVSPEPTIDLLTAHLPASTLPGVRFTPSNTWYVRPQQALASAYYLIDDLARDGRKVRFLGEPLPGAISNTPAADLPSQLRGWLRYEALINSALARHPTWIVCPYDRTTTSDQLLTDLQACHPQITSPAQASPSTSYLPAEHLIRSWSASPLPEPALIEHSQVVTADTLRGARLIAADHARELGLNQNSTQDFVYAVNEIASNAVEHGGGFATLRLWTQRHHLVCEISDLGPGLAEPLVGLLPPDMSSPRGRGLWITQQICQNLEIRSGPNGTTVRIHSPTN